MAEIGNGQQVQGQDAIWAGLATTGTTPELYLPRGMDNLGQMAFITRGTTKFLSMLHTRFKGSKTKNTREHRTHEMSELDRVYPVAKGSADFSSGVGATAMHNQIGIPNDMAIQIQENDVVFVIGLYSEFMKADNKLKYSTVFGVDAVNYEQCLVMAVGASDSAGAGIAKVTLRRAYYGKGKEDFTGTTLDQPTADLVLGDMAITTDMKIVRGLPSFPEGGDAPHGFHKNPVVDNNFTQEFKYAIEITKESEIEKTMIGKTPIEIYRLLKTRQATLDIERTFLNGRKGKQIDKFGRVQYTMGGVGEFIMRDTDHIHTYSNPAITYPGLLDTISKIPKDGGSVTRDFYCGITLYQEMKKAFYDKDFLRYNPEASKKFDIPIETLVGAGVEINVIPLYTLEEMGFGNRGLVIDWSVPSFTPVTHPGWDMKVEKDIEEKGKQIYKEQWIGIKGIERRYQQYQHMLVFPHI